MPKMKYYHIAAFQAFTHQGGTVVGTTQGAPHAVMVRKQHYVYLYISLYLCLCILDALKMLISRVKRGPHCWSVLDNESQRQGPNIANWVAFPTKK